MIDQPTHDSQSNMTEYSVSELSGSIKKTVEGAFSHVRLRGEISGFRGQHSSGHAYFSIKDERARMDAVVWKGVYSRLKFKPQEGMEMIATGKITTYPGSSKYQIVIEQLEPAGAGALMALLEERKKKLTAEGLFDADRKQLLPYMPKVIGVVTSPTGAVIRDILHRISDRFPIHVVVWPVRVQGETSGDEVAAAINGFNRKTLDGIPTPDLIIVARGGGSLEDLWGFNDEAVVRAAAQSDIPLISAVGHETDWTLLDLVADERAPTPTGAAEMAVPVKAELEAMTANLSARLNAASTRLVDQRRQHFGALARALPSLDTLLALPRRRIDEAQGLLSNALKLNLVNKRRSFERSEARLSPHSLQKALGERSARLQQRTQLLGSSLARIADRKRAQLTQSARALTPVPNQLNQRILQNRKSLQLTENRTKIALENTFSKLKQQYEAQARMLNSLSYKNVLKRGFALIRDNEKALVTSSNKVLSGQHLTIEFSDGSVDVSSDGTPQTPPNKSKKTKLRDAKPTKQGSLF